MPGGLAITTDEGIPTNNGASAPVLTGLSDTQKRLLEIWRGEFGITEMGRNDRWADFGIQSALILKVHRRIQDVFEREISIGKMYEYSTVQAFADYLDGNHTDNELSVVESRAQKARSSGRRRNRSKRVRV